MLNAGKVGYHIKSKMKIGLKIRCCSHTKGSRQWK